MKSNALLATFLLILFIKIINGEYNGLVYNENFETNSFASQQPANTFAVINNFQDLFNPNEIPAVLPNEVNRRPILTHTSSPPLSPRTQQIQLPPDLQQQPLQVQQYLQLQTPLQLQQSLPTQQALQLQPQMQVQPLPQSQQTLQRQFETQLPLLPTQSQDNLQLQQQVQVQPQVLLPIDQALQSQEPLLSNQYLQSYQPLQTLQPLQLQKPSQSQPSTKNLQQTLQSQDFVQTPHPISLQQPLGCQQSSPQKFSTERKILVETPITQHIINNQPNSPIQARWKQPNPQTVMEFENPPNTQILNKHSQQNSFNRPVEVIAKAQRSFDKPQEITSLRYYIASPQSSLSGTSAIVSNSPSFTIVPSNYLKPVEETYIPLTTSYNYKIPSSEVQFSVPDRTISINSIPSPPTIVTLPSPSIENTNTKLHYYNQHATDSWKNAYINRNSGFRYPEQTQLPVVLQSQPKPLVPSQSSTLSPIPVSVVQASPLSSQYAFSSGYPINTVMGPAYSSYRSKTSNMKAILPLIFNLLKEKIASCGCRHDCECECKNNSDKELEVSSGYSNQKDYGPARSRSLAILNALAEDVEGPEILREPKNSEKIKNISPEASVETLEEEDSDEEFDEGEED